MPPRLRTSWRKDLEKAEEQTKTAVRQSRTTTDVIGVGAKNPNYYRLSMLFPKLDVDANGTLSKEELEEAVRGHRTW